MIICYVCWQVLYIPKHFESKLRQATQRVILYTKQLFFLKGAKCPINRCQNNIWFALICRIFPNTNRLNNVWVIAFIYNIVHIVSLDEEGDAGGGASNLTLPLAAEWRKVDERRNADQPALVASACCGGLLPSSPMAVAGWPPPVPALGFWRPYDELIVTPL
jgi:hypothetical protein